MSYEEKKIEGTFDGEKMWGDDNRTYSVPANYVSKSKLVEGDRLKLTICLDGSFVFKQILPVERKKIRGIFTPEMHVAAEGKIYSIINSSLTYFKPGIADEAIIIVPVEGNPTWAALDNIIRKNIEEEI